MFDIYPALSIQAMDLQEKILAMKDAKEAQQRLNQAESRTYEAAMAIQSKVRQI